VPVSGIHHEVVHYCPYPLQCRYLWTSRVLQAISYQYASPDAADVCGTPGKRGCNRSELHASCHSLRSVSTMGNGFTVVHIRQALFGAKKGAVEKGGTPSFFTLH
jgi:hypothetical protein